MSKVKITPLGDRVLVKQVDEDEQIKGGIIIPDDALGGPVGLPILHDLRGGNGEVPSKLAPPGR